MNEFQSRGKEILKILINNGYEAFFVGESVRNIILGKTLKGIEITTSAHIEMVKKLFNDCLINDIDENIIELEYAGFIYVVKSFTTNVFKDNKSTIKHYSKNLLDDLSSRDFSINAIAMSNSGKLTDAYDGYDDIQNKLISHIGNAKERFYKDPSLIIKAFVLMSELNYKLAKKTKKAIKRRKKYLMQCNINLLLDDFKKMFEGVYAKKAISSICKTNVYKVIPEFKKVLKRLSISYKKQTFEEVLLMADILNGKLTDAFKDYIENYDEYIKVYDLVLANKNSKYDQLTLYSNGLNVCLKANKINYYLGRTRKKEKSIIKKWDNLIIKSVDELNYRVDELKKIIRDKDYSKIPFILDEAVKLILIGEIRNSKSDIEKAIIQILQKNNIFYSLQGVNNIEEVEEKIDVTPRLIEEDVIDELNETFSDNLEENVKRLALEIKYQIKESEYLKNKQIDTENMEEELIDLILSHIKEGDN